jgi:hypothetical protein
MTGLAISAVLAGGIAALAEIVVLRDFDRQLSPDAARLRLIAIAFVAGQAVLSVVVALLAFSFAVQTLAFPMEPFLPIFVTVGAFGTAFAYRAAAIREPFTIRDRARGIVMMAVSQGVTVIGVVLAMLALMLGS